MSEELDIFTKKFSELPLLIGKSKILNNMFCLNKFNCFYFELLKNNKMSKNFKTLYYSNYEEAHRLGYKALVEMGVPQVRLERVKAYSLDKDFLDKQEVAAMIDTKTSKTYFYSVKQNKIVPFCEKYFRKLYKMKIAKFHSILTPAPVIFDMTRPEGINGDSINCIDHSFHVFDQTFDSDMNS